MQYIIMLLIVIGLAIADYLTGIIKAYCKNDICNSTYTNWFEFTGHDVHS